MELYRHVRHRRWWAKGHGSTRVLVMLVTMMVVRAVGAATSAPTAAPTKAPTQWPTVAPTLAPTKAPTTAPTKAPTTPPTKTPTTPPTMSPTKAPTTSPSTYVWITDSYQVLGRQIPRSAHGTFNLTLTSNRKVIGGAYKIKVNFTVNHNRTDSHVGKYQLSTACIPYHASASYIRQQIRAVLIKFHKSRSSVPYEPKVVVQRRGNTTFGYNFRISNYTGYTKNTSTSNVTLAVAGLGSVVGCEDFLTYGKWSDASQWNWGTVPGSSHQVNIYQGSGIVALTSSVTISTLWMEGGRLVLGATDCDDGWTPSPDTSRNKCFRSFSAPLAWQDAEANCRSLAPQHRGHLARVESESENLLSRGLCRSRVGDGECWIGLRSTNTGQGWGWEEESTMLNTTYRSWEWREPDNRNHADGYENCTLVLSSYSDPFTQARAVWNDEACSLPRPYVCEKRGVTSRYTLTTSKNFIWRGGSILGPGNVTLNGVSYITAGAADVVLGNSAYLVNNRLLNVTAPQVHGASSYIVNNYKMTIGNESTTFLVDNSPPSQGFPPILRNSVGAILIVDTFSSYMASVQWVFQSFGAVRIKTGELYLRGGGYAYGGSFSVVAPHTLAIGNYSFQMMQHGMQLLTLQAAYPVADVNHAYGTNAGGLGSFRLKYGTSVTSCLSYHVTAAGLQTALNKLSSINAVGNVTVFRSGRPGDSSWGYGNRHQIVFDSLAAYNRTANTAISLSCTGSKGGCGCLDTTAEFIKAGGSRFSCSSNKFQNTSAVVSDRCTITPSITITVLRKGGEQSIFGTGTVYTFSGRHLLPSRIGANYTEVRGGVALTSNKYFTARTVTLRNGGMLLLAGTGYAGVDAARTFYDIDETRNGRNSPSLVSNPPVVYGTIKTLRIVNGTLAVASLLTDLTSGFLYWQGGTISGRFNLRVSSLILLNSTSTLRLRNGARLLNSKSLLWSGGNVSLSEGSFIQNYGNLTAKAPGKTMHMYYDPKHTGWSPSRCWSDGAWYSNPVCGGPDCLLTPSIENLLARSRIRLYKNTTVNLGLPLYQKGRVSVYDTAQLVLSGGGTHNGTIYISHDAKVNMTQGTFNMSRSSTLGGSGSLVVQDGHHQLPARIGARLLVVSGTAVVDAPTSRFVRDVDIAGGLLHFSRLKQNGTVAGNFTISNGVVLFSDTHNMYRDHRIVNDRSYLRFNSVMKWHGGTLTGNAVLQCYGTLDIDHGNKYLGGGLHVVYYETAYWGTGDIVAREEATMLHHGILQLKSPLTFTGRLAYENVDADGGQAAALLQWENK